MKLLLGFGIDFDGLAAFGEGDCRVDFGAAEGEFVAGEGRGDALRGRQGAGGKGALGVFRGDAGGVEAVGDGSDFAAIELRGVDGWQCARAERAFGEAGQGALVEEPVSDGSRGVGAAAELAAVDRDVGDRGGGGGFGEDQRLGVSAGSDGSDQALFGECRGRFGSDGSAGQCRECAGTAVERGLVDGRKGAFVPSVGSFGAGGAGVEEAGIDGRDFASAELGGVDGSRGVGGEGAFVPGRQCADAIDGGYGADGAGDLSAVCSVFDDGALSGDFGGFDAVHVIGDGEFALVGVGERAEAMNISIAAVFLLLEDAVVPFDVGDVSGEIDVGVADQFPFVCISALGAGADGDVLVVDVFCGMLMGDQIDLAHRGWPDFGKLGDDFDDEADGDRAVDVVFDLFAVDEFLLVADVADRAFDDVFVEAVDDAAKVGVFEVVVAVADLDLRQDGRIRITESH